jgi:hypothetical protein
MAYGSGQVIRQALGHARPWQRCVIALVMIVGGAGLAVLGHGAGVLLSAAGAVLVWRMLHGSEGGRGSAKDLSAP